MSSATLESVRSRALVRRTGWERPALVGLLAGTAVLYVAGLAASSWANGFYAAAVEAGSRSWKAFFFGSFDSSRFITVDKPPASLWVMELSARVFGLSSWSMLVPQALEGVAAVGLLYATVKRRFGGGAGLLAGAVLALTPVATLMFRFNNPDALLTLLLVAAAYALTRSLEERVGPLARPLRRPRRRRLPDEDAAGARRRPRLRARLPRRGPDRARARVRHLLGSGLALVVSAGWWVAAVELWPASSRPNVGGSQNNSILDLIFGYNGFGRLTGNESGSVVGGGGQGQAGAWGPTGLTRLLGSEMGTQISWLLPAALLFAVAVLWARRRAPRTDGKRAAVLLWGSWLVVTGLVFSLSQGTTTCIYNVVLAPAIGALVGIGAAWTWAARSALLTRVAGAAAVAGTAVWAYELLDRTPSWHPALRTAVLGAGAAAALLLLLPPRRLGRAGVAVAALAVAASLAAPAAYSLQTASVAQTASIPSAGPSGASGFGGRGGGFPRGGARGFGGGTGRAQGFGGAPPGAGNLGGAERRASRRRPADSAAGATAGSAGCSTTSTPSAALVQLLRADASRYTWVAAGVGANSVAGVQLAADEPVMAIGGFNGTDPSPTLAQFEAYVQAGKIHYFLASGGGGFGGPGDVVVLERDRELGRVALRGADRGRRHRVRPDRRLTPDLGSAGTIGGSTNAGRSP